ncbi:MAG: CCA tRNA nucleotidyltransferase [Lachnospiraceae bacterium]
MKILMPKKVNTIIHTFQTHGYEAYAVGGCVRDSVLGRVPEDWDITTSAMPWQTKALFRRTFDTGIAHGTITVLIEDEAFEVTTYRIDGEYEDGRHPKQVEFTRSLQEDLLRRDFTMNAMAYNDQEGLVDVFHGLEDLKGGFIRCVGNPDERFAEDALRILRAVRFAAQLGFEIEEKTKEAARKAASSLEKISAERIQSELVKLLISDKPQCLYILRELQITKVILPEFDDLFYQTKPLEASFYNVGNHTVASVCAVPGEKVLRLAMLLHEMEGEHTVKHILKRFKFDNDTLRKVCRLVAFHGYHISSTDQDVRIALHQIGSDLFLDYLKVKVADAEAFGENHQEVVRAIAEIKARYLGILQRGECISLRELAVTGSDLIQQGISPGKQIGEVLNALLEVVLRNPEYNKKEYLLSYVNKYFQ